MSKKVYWLIFAILLVLALFARFYKLGQLPPGIMVDESIIGYDAFSIYKTGKDIWGKPWPLIFKSFGDYKPPGLEYTIAFLLNFLPLNTFITRLPSALGGLLAALGIYLIIRELFPKKYYLAGIGSIIFLFSPWSFQLSRLYFEANLALGFFTLGVAMLIRYLRRTSKRNNIPINLTLLLGLFFLAFSGYFYVAHRVAAAVITLSFILLLLIKSKETLSRQFFFKLFLTGLLFLVMGAPMLWQLFSAQGRIRLSQQNELAAFGNALVINEARKNCYISTNKNLILTKLCYAFWNKPIEKLTNFFRFYLQHFSLNFLFFAGGQLQNVSMPGKGNFQLILLPIMVLGWYVLIKKSFRKKNIIYKFLSFSLLIAPFPASLAGSPIEQRSNPLLPFLIVTVVLGFNLLLENLSPRHWKGLLVTAIFLIWSFGTAKYFVNYFWVYTRKEDTKWRVGLPETIQLLNKVEKDKDYEKIFIKDIYEEDFLLALSFYNNISPQDFQDKVVWSKPNKGGWVYPRRLYHYQVGGAPLTEILEDYYFQQRQGTVLYLRPPDKRFAPYAVESVFDRLHVHNLVDFYDIAELAEKMPEQYFLEIGK